MSSQQNTILPFEVVIDIGEQEMAPNSESRWQKLRDRVTDWLEYHNRGEWINDMKVTLGLMATLIAAMSCQLSTNPPGGVVQGGVGDRSFCSTRSFKVNSPKSLGSDIDITIPAGRLCAGQALSAIGYPSRYIYFMVFNNISFYSSIGVCLLLMTGLNHLFPVWLLSIGMCTAIVSFTITYHYSNSIVAPIPIWISTSDDLSSFVTLFLSVLAGIVGVVFIIRYILSRKRNQRNHLANN